MCRLLAPANLFCFFVLLRLLPARAQLNQTFQIYQIPNFNSTTTESLDFYGAATYRGDALQFTPSVRAPGGLYESGAVVFNQSFWLVTRKRGDVQMASFSTVFDMSMSGDSNLTRAGSLAAGPGVGLSFIVFRVKENSLGGWISCLNRSSVGISCLNYEQIAVRFNPRQVTFQFRDRDDNQKNNSQELSPSNSTIFNYTVWVDIRPSVPYLGIQVYAAAQGSPKPAKPVLSDTVGFGFVSVLDYNDKIHFGFTGPSSDGAVPRSSVRSWTLSVELVQPMPPVRYLTSRVQTGVIILTTAIATVMLILVVVLGIYVRRKMRENNFLEEALRSLPGMPKEFNYADLKKATGNFSERNKLGQGGFGAVYKGRLAGEGKLVAVKRFLRETDQGGFLSELTIINRLRHRNLVTLLGWSHKNKRLLLVYDYMPNGSLDKHLFSQEDSITLSWERRYNILRDVASALNYLHNEYIQKVIHRDLKASNIMLDADFNAYLGDFGLARSIDNGRTSYIDLGDRMPGTWGYIAPECMLIGRATRESDVFGFGVVVFEVVSGRRPGARIGNFRLLAEWIWALHKDGRVLEAVDPRLKNEYDVDEAQRLLLLGLACTQLMRSARPKAHEIQQIMLKSVSPPSVPLERPMFMNETLSSDSDDSMDHIEESVGDRGPLLFTHDQTKSSYSTRGVNATI